MPLKLHQFALPLSDSRWDRLAFRLEHWLLSAGASDDAKVRGYLRVKRWRDCHGARERLHGLKVLVKLPARALRESRQMVGVYGGEAAAESNVSRTRQLLHLWWLWVRHGVYPETYYRYRLFQPGQLHRAPRYFQKSEAPSIYRLLSARVAPDAAELLTDKPRFERWLVEHGLPTIRTILEFDGGDAVGARLPVDGLPRRDLFSKFSDSFAGNGAQRWPYDGEGWVGPDGRRRSEQELIAELVAMSRTRGVLLQEQMRNHPALAPLAPAALSTMRLLTLRGVDGAVQLVLAVAKIPTGAAATDHLKFGGLAAPIDLATGRLGRAVRKHEGRLTSYRDEHPDTGAPIAGFQMPHWESAKELAIRAHERLGQLACIGWDVAILSDGPVIIEGNDDPGPESVQMPGNVALGETPVLPVLAAHLRAAFAGTPPARARGVAHPDPVRPLA